MDAEDWIAARAAGLRAQGEPFELVLRNRGTEAKPMITIAIQHPDGTIEAPAPDLPALEVPYFISKVPPALVPAGRRCSRCGHLVCSSCGDWCDQLLDGGKLCCDGVCTYL